MSRLTKASFLQDPSKRIKVFARFSTVAGGAGSVDTPRDVRGFAVRFYTDEGNYDLVGNNIPVFFIQDAMKFPDLIHAVKMEPDRGFPQAASAHDTFWDFVSLMPESMHMLMWAMSDRAIPRSLRHIEGFGIHTFRFVNARGDSTFVKFHWRPSVGAASTLWDEAVKIAGADPDYTRRDLWESIDNGDFPEWTLNIQAFDQATADKLDFDILDPTKIIPEEIIPLTPIGRMVLNQNPVNFFAETEQIAFHPGSIVPGIDFTADPLLQGRLFSYIDTQLIRLGGPNFHEIPINRPVCPMRNFQRDGHMRMQAVPGRVSYEPNSLDPASPKENPGRGFASFPDPNAGPKQRLRPESFADHYSQGRQFWKSMTAPEQGHIVSAFTFELSKVETVAIRQRMLGHLDLLAPELGQRVAKAMGMEGQAEKITPAVRPRDDLPPSPALSIVGKAPATVKGRTMAALVTDGSDGAAVEAAAGGAEEGRRQPQADRAQDRQAQGQRAGARPDDRGWPLGAVRRRRADAVGGRRPGASGHGGGRQLAARRLRPPQGHRLQRGVQAVVRQGRRQARRQAGCRVAGRRGRRRGLYRHREEAQNLGPGEIGEPAAVIHAQGQSRPLSRQTRLQPDGGAVR